MDFSGASHLAAKIPIASVAQFPHAGPALSPTSAAVSLTALGICSEFSSVTYSALVHCQELYTYYICRYYINIDLVC